MPKVLQGGIHTDERGILHFLNEFDMEQVKRFYSITHTDIETKRGWRGHQIEQRWFYVVTGGFEIEYVKIDDWNEPNPRLEIEVKSLSAIDNQALHMPKGYATRIRALVENSRVILFSDYRIEHAKLDDHLWPIDYFKTKK